MRTLEKALRTFVTTAHNNKEPDQSDPGSRKQTRSSTRNAESNPDMLSVLGHRRRGLCGKLEPDSNSDRLDANHASACLPGLGPAILLDARCFTNQ
jgi:hypothetical protein